MKLGQSPRSFPSRSQEIDIPVFELRMEDCLYRSAIWPSPRRLAVIGSLGSVPTRISFKDEKAVSSSIDEESQGNRLRLSGCRDSAGRYHRDHDLWTLGSGKVPYIVSIRLRLEELDTK